MTGLTVALINNSRTQKYGNCKGHTEGESPMPCSQDINRRTRKYEVVRSASTVPIRPEAEGLTP
jgi:hypothetical protein